jgi:Fe-coproporphyrin III synthase
MYPKHAIIAVTLNCNSRCIMCDIWKNRIPHELAPNDFLKIPSSLIDINITGGEPFLRRDLVDIIANMKKAAPSARLVMISNGFMPHRAAQDLPKIKAIDSSFAFRVSMDGIGEAHDKIRRIPGGFEKILKTIEIARSAGIHDLGISFTVIDQNVREIPKVRAFAQKNNLEFSITVATNSVIYFGSGKENLRPTNPKLLDKNLADLAKSHFKRLNPKEIVRGWFVKQLLRYIQTGKRALPCDAGQGFFYMDSIGNVYTCHLKPWIMGNIKTNSLDEIFGHNRFAREVAACNACWMVCTSKSMMKKRLAFLFPEIVPDVISAALSR